MRAVCRLFCRCDLADLGCGLLASDICVSRVRRWIIQFMQYGLSCLMPRSFIWNICAVLHFGNKLLVKYEMFWESVTSPKDAALFRARPERLPDSGRGAVLPDGFLPCILSHLPAIKLQQCNVSPFSCLVSTRLVQDSS